MHSPASGILKLLSPLPSKERGGPLLIEASCHFHTKSPKGSKASGARKILRAFLEMSLAMWAP